MREYDKLTLNDFLTKHLLDEHMANSKTYGDRAYSVAAPKLWNKSALDIGLSSSVNVLKD